MKTKKTIVLTGGGTAGHVYPALSVAENLTNHNLHYIGGCGMEKDVLKGYSHISYHEIPTVKLQRKFTLQNLAIPFKLCKSISQTKKILKEINPSVVFSKGGFVAVPVAIAAKQLKIPVISHESDLSMGLANKIILRFCDKMCTTFEETAEHSKKCIYTGQPIRSKIFKGIKQDFGFDKNKPTVLMLGGSLGAKFLNDIVFDNLDALTKYFNVLHICGKNNFKEISKANYKGVPYAENIENFYASADVAIARAGSGVINELLVLQKPMLLIPLSKKCSRGDQIENAKLFNKLGYCELIEEEEYKFEKLLEKLEKILKNSENIKKNMKNSAKNNANQEIINILNNYLN